MSGSTDFSGRDAATAAMAVGIINDLDPLHLRASLGDFMRHSERRESLVVALTAALGVALDEHGRRPTDQELRAASAKIIDRIVYCIAARALDLSEGL